MGYRQHPPPTLKLIGYDPVRDLPADHLARLVELVVEECVRPQPKMDGRGQPEFDPRLLTKILVYGYATGVRSSRRLEQLCDESLPFLYLTRGDTPSYRTFCSARLELGDVLEVVWIGLFTVAAAAGIKRIGHLVVDSSKFAADASPDAVLRAAEYEPVLAELRRILAEAQEVDEREEREGLASSTSLGQPVKRETMRDILRRVRKGEAKARRAKPSVPSADPGSCAQALLEMETDSVPAGEAATGPPDDPPPPATYTKKMLDRIEEAAAAIEAAQKAEEKHLCLTDPDARMMYGGRVRSTRECHSFEIAVDNGLLVAGQSTQKGSDNDRLEPLVQAAQAQEPEGVRAVDADSGYYSGDAVNRLLEQGIDLCVPDSNTACDLHRGQPVGTCRQKTVGFARFEYDANTDSYLCAAGQTLDFLQERQEYGQTMRTYRTKADCQACSLAADCLAHKEAYHRTLKVGVHQEALQTQLARFSNPAHVERYHHRSEQVETVFGFLRGTLGYHRWSLRGKPRVACESRVFKLAYQFRKVHTALLKGGMNPAAA